MTLIEFIVVTVIILGLLTVLIPLLRPQRTSHPQPIDTHYLAAIEVALQAYRMDFNDLPPSDHTRTTWPIVYGEWDGGEIMAQALFGPLPEEKDGADGYGYTTPVNRHIRYGPYLAVEYESTLVERVPGRWVLTNAWSDAPRPILYYRANMPGYHGRRDPDKPIWGGEGSRFVISHNDVLDGEDDPASHWPRHVAPDEQEATWDGPRYPKYVIISAGPDGVFGADSSIDYIETGW